MDNGQLIIDNEGESGDLRPAVGGCLALAGFIGFFRRVESAKGEKSAKDASDRSDESDMSDG